jgi:hypothetical protein
MTTTRTSLEGAAEQEKRLEATRSLQDALEKANLKLKSNAAEFHTTRLEIDGDETILKDPAIVASDVAAQMVGRFHTMAKYARVDAQYASDVS